MEWYKTAKVISINRKPINVLDDKQTFVDAIQARYWDEKSRV